MALDDKQNKVLRGMIAALLLAIAVVVGARLGSAGLWLPPDTVPGRLGYTLPFDLLMVVALLVHVGLLARHRFFTPEDIDGSGLTSGTERARVLQALLQNTLEQLTLAFPVHVIWALLMPMPWLPVAPACALCFATGRLLFGLGYARGAGSRALGFALTFYPTVVMVLILGGHIFATATRAS